MSRPVLLHRLKGGDRFTINEGDSTVYTYERHDGMYVYCTYWIDGETSHRECHLLMSIEVWPRKD